MKGTPAFGNLVTIDAATARLIVSAHRTAEAGASLAADVELGHALAWVLRWHTTPRSGSEARTPGHRAAAKAREILHERMVSPPPLTELAAAVAAPPFGLLRAFREVYGLPPHSYLTQLRVRRARELLAAGTAPAVAAAQVGFADQSHLTRHFRRIVGVPPGSYQRARKNVQGTTGSIDLPWRDDRARTLPT